MKFSVAYLGNRVTVLRPVDPASPMQPKTIRRRGVVIELHDGHEGARIFREILHSSGGKAMLGAAEILDEPITVSPYAAVLQRAASAAGVTLW